MRATGAFLDRFRRISVARSLLIGDLPTTLWWASDRPPVSAGKLFAEFDERLKGLVGARTGRILRAGQPIRVAIDHIDLQHRQVDLLLAQ